MSERKTFRDLPNDYRQLISDSLRNNSDFIDGLFHLTDDAVERTRLIMAASALSDVKDMVEKP